MSWEDDDYKALKQIADNLQDVDDDEGDPRGLAWMLAEKLGDITNAIDRLTTAVEKLSGKAE